MSSEDDRMMVRVSVRMPTITPGQTYEAGGQFEHLSALFCPACGKHAVWVLHNGGDYYLGESMWCVDCGANGHGWEATPNERPGPVCEALRAMLKTKVRT